MNKELNSEKVFNVHQNISFRSPANNEINKTLLRDIKALAGMEKISHQDIPSDSSVVAKN